MWRLLRWPLSWTPAFDYGAFFTACGAFEQRLRATGAFFLFEPLPDIARRSKSALLLFLEPGNFGIKAPDRPAQVDVDSDVWVGPTQKLTGG